MRSVLDSHSPTVSTPALQARLEEVLCRHFGDEVRVVELQRRISPLRSSFALEEIDVSLAGEAVLPLIFKDLSWSALQQEARRAKPLFLYNPLREIEIYRNILPPRLGPTFYGGVTDARHGRYWLFLERVTGHELYQCDADAWTPVATWLAGMHGRLSHRLQTLHSSWNTPFLQHDARYYRVWMERAQAFARRSELTHPGKRVAIEWLAQRYDVVVECLLDLPRTIIHGEFFPSNILVRQAGADSLICPIDWEMTGIGPGLIDLAALVSGRWTQDKTTELALAYRSALAATTLSVPPTEVFLRNLDYCRLHLAMQRLGWSVDWQPPPRHAWNWVKEAVELAEKLRL